MDYLYLAAIFMSVIINGLAHECESQIIDVHLKNLDNMIDAQLITSCSVEVKLIDEKQLDRYCYKRLVISQLPYLLEHLKFKHNSQYFNETAKLLNFYNERFQDCISENEDIEEEDLLRCSRRIYLSSPAELLDRIKRSFEIFKDFKYYEKYDCHNQYKMCKEDNHPSTIGPQCACQSPTTPILSGTATEKPKSKLSETKSTPYAPGIPSSTGSFTDDISGTESQNPQQRIEMSSVILTSRPTDAKLLTTIMDHLHATTTDRLVSGPESPPHVKMDISLSDMELTTDITESTYATSLSQTKTFESKDLSQHNTESLNTDGSHTQWLSASTIFNKDFSQITGELSSVTEPVVDELLEITELNTVSPTSVSNVQTFFESSMEPIVESSPSNTVTKTRRSVENADKAYVSTHAQPVLATDDSATMPSQLTFAPTFKSHHTVSQEGETSDLGWADSYLFSTVATTKTTSTEADDDSATKSPQLTFSPTIKFHHTMSQEGEIRNLGWADSYLFSTVATTKPTSTEENDNSATKLPQRTFPPTFKSHHTMSQEGEIRNLGWADSYIFSTVATTKPTTTAKMSSPVSGVQSLSSGASLHPKLTVHKGGDTYNNNLQEPNVEAFKSEDRENRVAGPIHTFHLHPIPETERHEDGRQKINLLLVMIPSFVAIVCLCGLLYVIYHNRLLRQQLNRAQEQELPELRPLAE